MYYEVFFWSQRTPLNLMFLLLSLKIDPYFPCTSEAVFWKCPVNKVFLKILQNSRECKCLESIFDKIAGLKACNLTY